MVAVNYLWDPEEDNIVKELDDAGATIADYTTEPFLYGDVIGQHRDGQSRFYHFDTQGNTTELTDSSGNTTDTRRYTAFGETSESTGGTVLPFQYIGQKEYYRDTVTGQYMARRRPYEPARKRWLSVDPLRSSHILNYYSYATNRPVSAIDPSGMVCCCTETPHFVLIATVCPYRIGFYWGVDRSCAWTTGPTCASGEKPPTWEEACDPRTACGKVGFTPLLPPVTPPNKAGMPCNYPDRLVCWGGMCWQSQCVCQCAGNSPNLNCMRGCISQCDKLGGPKTVEPEVLCKTACGPLTANEKARLSCCLNKDWNMGGCNIPPFEFPGHKNPNPANTTCTSMPVP